MANKASNSQQQPATAANANAPAVPTNSITLVQLCNLAQLLGLSRGYAVRLCGGDACRKAPTNSAFTVTYAANPNSRNSKYVPTAALNALANAAIASNPQLTKAYINAAVKVCQQSGLNYAAKNSPQTLQQAIASAKALASKASQPKASQPKASQPATASNSQPAQSQPASQPATASK